MYLSNYPFYKQLDSQSLEFLQKNLQAVRVPKGNILFFQGEVCDNILFLTKGSVRLYIQSDNAEEITLYQLKEGEQCIVNTASTISQTEAIGSAVTITDIEGYLISVHTAQALAKMSHIYQSYLFSIYTLRMDSLVKLINDIQFKNLDERVLSWLYEKKTQFIQTTHENIANELGSSRVVISRILKELEHKHKLILTRGKIELLHFM